MKHHALRGGDRMPALGLGTWKAEPDRVGAAVREALRLGYRHLDCASIYGNEAEIGAALAAADVRRSDLWITSKLWNDAHLPEHVRPRLEQQLQDLRLDHLDLYLMHWPVASRPVVVVPQRPEEFLSLEDVPLETTWEAMEACVRAGLCRHIGVSNFSVRKIADLCVESTIPPEVDQVEMHPLLQQQGLLDWCRERGMVVTAYSPLGSGDRPATMKREDEPDLLHDPVIAGIAGELDRTPAQVLIAWAIQRGTAVIPKSSNPARLAENLAAAELELPEEAMQRIAGLDRHYRYVDGSFWATEGSPYTLAGLWDE